ncbi:MAG TPA: TonB-dependent receptor [Vicinamibacterales bacterium]|nr:TonB-dependent receptor [Vicinamibacterales bacterium]
MIRVMRAIVAIVGATVILCGFPSASAAQGQATLTGQVVDALGARVAGAKVALLRDGAQVTEVASGSDGTFTFQNVTPGRYQVIARAEGFEPKTSEPVYVGPGARPSVEVVLEIGPLQQDVLVTAAAGEILQSQSGAPVTVIDSSTLDALNKPDLLEALRLVPGAQIVQVGQRGGGTSLFLRGGNSNFTKVLIDGIPANDIGGGFDFSQLDTAGVDRIEVLRQTNSVIYGSDALTGVVNITTRRGTSRLPELEYAIDGGNLSTFRNSLAFGGAVRRFDYFSQYAYFTTDNHTPNSGYRRGTYAGRFGVALGAGTNLSGTLRRIDGTFGSASGFNLYQVADDSTQDSGLTYVSVTADSQISNRWQSTIRFGSADQTSEYLNPAPTGQPFDPFGFGANYLGHTVTLTGANGTSVTGQAILDFGGAYPQTFYSRTTRRALFGQTTFQVIPELAISGGARYDREEGFGERDAEPDATRSNGGAFVEARAALANRAYLSGGIGVEHNAAFGTAYTPRLSMAVYLRNPSAKPVGDTKVTLNVGEGIKAPSVYQDQNALFSLVQGTPGAAGVSPIGPERSRGFDVALEQGFAAGRFRTRLGYFNNDFENLLEFLSKSALTLAGVPADVAAATAFGAYINSQSYHAQGVELSADGVLGRVVRIGASYTYLDAEVTQAFSASAASNASFPGVAIGAFSPLVGERPFRRPANSGTLFISYADGPASVALAAYFAGKRDDSTFLSDGFFGNSLLLPNQDLDPAYQKIDLSASYRVHPRLRIYTSIENLLDKDYAAAYGFPALPFTIRAGLSVNFGGDRPAQP